MHHCFFLSVSHHFLSLSFHLFKSKSLLPSAGIILSQMLLYSAFLHPTLHPLHLLSLSLAFSKWIVTHTSSLCMSSSVTPALFIPLSLFLLLFQRVQAGSGRLRAASHHSQLITVIVLLQVLHFTGQCSWKSTFATPVTFSAPKSTHTETHTHGLGSDPPLTFSQAHLHQFHTSNALQCRLG